MAYFSVTDEGLLLHCHIQPRASRDAIAGLHGDRLKIQITAPPADGRANDQLLGFLAAAAGVAKSRLTLIRGQTSRQKTVLIAGLDAPPPDFPQT